MREWIKLEWSLWWRAYHRRHQLRLEYHSYQHKNQCRIHNKRAANLAKAISRGCENIVLHSQYTD